MSVYTYNFNTDWYFTKGDTLCRDTAEVVCLPHSVELTPENSSGCRNYQGKMVYEKDFFVDADKKGFKCLLEFEGIMGVSRLYLNGEHISSHYCGYTPFVTDISDKLKYGETNTVKILADNSNNPEVPPGKPQGLLDFSYDGGIYRSAKLKFFDKLYITHPLLANVVAGGGIFVRYAEVNEKQATVITKTHVKNEREAEQRFTLFETLLYKGEPVAAISQTKTLPSGGDEHYEGEIKVPNPRLWSVNEPNLYTLRTELMIDGETVYFENTEIGIRDFEFTIDDGVIFNGKSHRFGGVNYHQTWPYIGNAVPDSLLLRDMMQLKEMGTKSIRSHYPFSHAVTDACNRLGMVLIVSNPGWQFCADGIFMERALQNMRDIVRWQRNNPCVLLWEPVLNESQMSYEVQLGFHNVVHEEFPFSPCYTASDYGPTDVAYGDYDPAMLGTWHERYGLCEQKDTTPRPKWVREYGDAPDDFTNQNAIWRIKRGWGDYPQYEAVNRMLHRFDASNVKQYVDMYNDKRICGYGVWPGIAHNRGYHINPCWGGHLDLFRLPKFSYYLMQSQLDRKTAGDILFIATWWTEISPPDVMVFSNAERIKLYCDDELIGEQTPDDVPIAHPPFTFKAVKRNYKRRERSVLKAEAYIGDEKVAEYSVQSPGIANRLCLEYDSMGLPLKADGSDIAVIRCRFVDSSGNTVPIVCDEHPVVFEIEGEGEIVGDEAIGANPRCAEAGIVTVLVRSTKKAGEIRIKAKMLWEQHFFLGIKPDELTIESIEA